jgi:acetoin utilization protein AcuB
MNNRLSRVHGGAAVKQFKKMPIVGAVMTSFPYSVDVWEGVARIEAKMDEHGIRHLPVQENGRVVGVVSERDLQHRMHRGAATGEKAQLRARDVMVGDPYVVSFRTPLNEVMAQMALRHIGSAIVLRRGKLAGILSAVDVCRIFAEYLTALFPEAGGDAAA